MSWRGALRFLERDNVLNKKKNEKNITTGKPPVSTATNGPYKFGRINFWRKTIGRYTKQPIKKIYILFEFSRVSPGDQRLTKKPGDSGIEIGANISTIRMILDVQSLRKLLRTQHVCIFHTFAIYSLPTSKPK